ncbi:hypothetical protein HYFRA_00008273 [Hymenoscyphus fraxineus]|uniref:Uncharacterized protein n=1 Tax=Hymenoscyphus fraxineus TaxID=746836 RepID=A0A9N9KN67_9HELO|nr:hypothetical protein HYFRA_00008273 [Hymenoscyphus fraxineus]
MPIHTIIISAPASEKPQASSVPNVQATKAWESVPRLQDLPKDASARKEKTSTLKLGDLEARGDPTVHTSDRSVEDNTEGAGKNVCTNEFTLKEEEFPALPDAPPVSEEFRRPAMTNYDVVTCGGWTYRGSRPLNVSQYERYKCAY